MLFVVKVLVTLALMVTWVRCPSLLLGWNRLILILVITPVTVRLGTPG